MHNYLYEQAFCEHHCTFSIVLFPWTLPIFKKCGITLSFFDKGLQRYFIQMVEQIVNSRKAGDMVRKTTYLPLDKMAAILADDIFKCIYMCEKERI